MWNISFRSPHWCGELGHTFPKYLQSSFRRIRPYWKTSRSCRYPSECSGVSDCELRITSGAGTWTRVDPKPHCCSRKGVARHHKADKKEYYKAWSQSIQSAFLPRFSLQKLTNPYTKSSLTLIAIIIHLRNSETRKRKRSMTRKICSR